MATLSHKISPYLLGAVEMTRPNQVWRAEMTYVPMSTGCMDLGAILDCCRRYGLAWELSNRLDPGCCLEALARALGDSCPEIFNTDQGVQWTSLAFTTRLERAGIASRMDGRGRALDQSFVERFGRSVTSEDRYLQDYATVPALAEGLGSSCQFYNHERSHQRLASCAPAEIHGVSSRCEANHPPYCWLSVVLTMGSSIMKA
jgi:putative transposase